MGIKTGVLLTVMTIRDEDCLRRDWRHSSFNCRILSDWVLRLPMVKCNVGYAVGLVSRSFILPFTKGADPRRLQNHEVTENKGRRDLNCAWPMGNTPSHRSNPELHRHCDAEVHRDQSAKGILYGGNNAD